MAKAIAMSAGTHIAGSSLYKIISPTGFHDILFIIIAHFVFPP